VEKSKEVRSRCERRVRELRGPTGLCSSDERPCDVLSLSRRPWALPLVSLSFGLLPSISDKRDSNRAQILALNTAASQYRQMPQQRPEMSCCKRGSESRDSIQFNSGTGTLVLLALCADVPSSVGIDIVITDCRSGSVRRMIGIRYSLGGNGGGADKTRLCVCIKPEPG
jgi:hypothetical protein